MEFVVSGLVATLVMLPILSYLIVFIVAKKWTKNHRQSVQIAMDLSTILFIVSVHYLILTIWNKHLFWLILLIVLCIACCVVIVHYKVNKEIVLKKVLRGIWRLNFMCFFCVYFLLFIFGVISRIVEGIAV